MKQNIVFTLLFVIFCGVILALSIRGIPGNPTERTINLGQWGDEGPMELSPERGRFALLYSIAENSSFEFSLPIARFTTPDLGFVQGRYVSLFAPAVSFVAIPGYLAGKAVGIAQVGAYAVIAVFALINAVFLRAIAMKLGCNVYAATLGAIAFLFATPAFAYGVSFYQHHISTFLILASIYFLLRYRGLGPLVAIWFFAALSIPVDYPNFIMMLPIAIYALGRIVWVEPVQNNMKVHIKLAGLLTFAGAILPLVFFFWFNAVSYGSPLQLSGTLARVKEIDQAGNPTRPADSGTERGIEASQSTNDKTVVNFFDTRYLRNGFFTHFISPDRGIISFTPIVLLGIVGVPFLYRKKPHELALFLGIIGANILLYSMWGDPYGGWAFGSRYLIPSYALLCILIAISLHHLRRRTVVLVIFFLLFEYSLAVNSVGALTSSRNPPKAEVLGLEKLSGIEQKYTYARNLDILSQNRLKSFVWQAVLKNQVNAWQYYQIIVGLVSFASAGMLAAIFITSRGKYESS